MSLWGTGVINAVVGWQKVKGWSSTTCTVYTYTHTCMYMKLNDPILPSTTHTCMQCTILWWLLSYTWPSQLCWGMQEFNNGHPQHVPPTMFNLPMPPHHYVQVSNCCTVSGALHLFGLAFFPEAGCRVTITNSVKCSSPPLKADMQ